MRRAFTVREKVLIVVLALILIVLGYYKLLLEPINESISTYQMNTETEQDQIIQNTVSLTKMNEMQTELDALYASGEAKPLPAYDNTDEMLTELNTILGRSSDYSLTFGSVAALEETPYIMARAVDLVFYAANYETARSILDELHESDNINQVSDLSVTVNDDGSVSVTLSLSYFELAE